VRYVCDKHRRNPSWFSARWVTDAADVLLTQLKSMLPYSASRLGFTGHSFSGVSMAQAAERHTMASKAMQR